MGVCGEGSVDTGNRVEPQLLPVGIFTEVNPSYYGLPLRFKFTVSSRARSLTSGFSLSPWKSSGSSHLDLPVELR